MDDGYITKDLGEVAALVSSGCALPTVHWKDDTGYFQFRQSPTCEQLSKQYYTGSLMVNARNYYDNLRLVKRKLYADDTTPGAGRFRRRP